jgi:foldase protein PrsA
LRTTAGSSLIAALAAALLIPVHARAQVPGDAVALVGSRPLTRATFDHWFRVAATSADGRVPRRYGACRQPRRRQCRAAQRGLRDETMQFLVSAYWIEGEVVLQGVVVTHAEAEEAFQRLRRVNFPTAKDFRRFLREAGETVADLRFRARLQLLSDRLREKILATVGPVTDDDVVAYYLQHPGESHVPEVRDIHFVEAPTAAQARRSLRLLRAGVSWRHVAQVLDLYTGRRPVIGGVGERSLIRAAFRAPRHRLRGPVHTRSGYWVFEVTHVRPARRLSLQQVADGIRDRLQSQREEVALGDFVRDFQARWRSVTICRSGFVTPDCGN